MANIAEEIKQTTFRVTRCGELIGHNKVSCCYRLNYCHSPQTFLYHFIQSCLYFFPFVAILPLHFSTSD